VEIGEENAFPETSSCALDMDTASRHAIGIHNAFCGLDVQTVGGHIEPDTDDVE
jgi:hypothetical protein